MIKLTEKQKRIMNAFLVVADGSSKRKDITMQRIADKAGIDRQNIYRYYSDIEAIVTMIHNYVDEECHDLLLSFDVKGDTDFIAYFAKEVLPVLYDKRAILKVLYGTVADASWFNFLEKEYLPLVSFYVIQSRSARDIDLPTEFISGLIIRQFLATIAEWILSEKPEPPILFQEKFITIMSTSTHSYFSSRSKK